MTSSTRITRREGLALGAGALAAAASPAPAAGNGFGAALDEVLSGRTLRNEYIDLAIPADVENGNRAKLDIFAPGAERVVILSPLNPLPRIAEYQFGPLAGAPKISSYIRLAGSQTVTAIALYPDGGAARADRPVSVLVGGCGAAEEEG